MMMCNLKLDKMVQSDLYKIFKTPRNTNLRNIISYHEAVKGKVFNYGRLEKVTVR